MLINAIKPYLWTIACLIAGIGLWYYLTQDKPSDGVWISAQEAKEVRTLPTTVIRGKIQVYAPQAATKLNIPLADEKTNIVAATTHQASERPVTVVTTLDAETGEVKTIFREEDYPLFMPESRGEASISYGYRGADKIARLSVSYEMLQVKGFHFGPVANFDNDGKYFAGVRISFRW